MMLLLALLSSLHLTTAALEKGCHNARVVNDVLIGDCLDPATGIEFLYVDTDRSAWADFMDQVDNYDADKVLYEKWMNATTSIAAGSNPLQRRRDPSSDAVGDDISLQTLRDPQSGQLDADVEPGLPASSPSPENSDQSQLADASPATTAPTSRRKKARATCLAGYEVSSKNLAILATTTALVGFFRDSIIPYDSTRRERCSNIDGRQICASFSKTDNDFFHKTYGMTLVNQCVDKCLSEGYPCQVSWVEENRWTHKKTVEHLCLGGRTTSCSSAKIQQAKILDSAVHNTKAKDTETHDTDTQADGADDLKLD